MVGKPSSGYLYNIPLLREENEDGERLAWGLPASSADSAVNAVIAPTNPPVAVRSWKKKQKQKSNEIRSYIEMKVKENMVKRKKVSILILLAKCFWMKKNKQTKKNNNKQTCQQFYQRSRVF